MSYPVACDRSASLVEATAGGIVQFTYFPVYCGVMQLVGLFA
jgi:hypothetical protein